MSWKIKGRIYQIWKFHHVPLMPRISRGKNGNRNWVFLPKERSANESIASVLTWDGSFIEIIPLTSLPEFWIDISALFPTIIRHRREFSPRRPKCSLFSSQISLIPWPSLLYSDTKWQRGKGGRPLIRDNALSEGMRYARLQRTW